MLVMVTLAAAMLTVPVNQAEETSRQLHTVQLAAATATYIYKKLLLQIVGKILPIVPDADRPIWGVWQLCGPSNTLSIEIATHIAIAIAYISQRLIVIIIKHVTWIPKLSDKKMK